MSDREKELFDMLWELRAYFLRGDTSRWPEESRNRINAALAMYSFELSLENEQESEAQQ